MKWRYHDIDKVRMWPREHWHVALYGLGALAVLTAVLVEFRVLSERAGVAAYLASAIYVLWTTWRHTRGVDLDKKAPENDRLDS